MNMYELLAGLGLGGGMAPYGLRHAESVYDPMSAKGKGYFGMLPTSEGMMATEISADSDIGQYPLLVPTLTAEEVQWLLNGNEPTEDIYRKAEQYAVDRMQQGMSPFAGYGDLRMPVGLLER
jgi:hypothetical protein